ncbi:TPA: ABC transporter ATP-binding protein [Candidatus Sumerlaeota bacterium]|jgi:ABC-2 type transport system ATP-binding protein|nr:ABC transporter ATP-binding protein [Candidatus Sumerlaeota bacterium]
MGENTVISVKGLRKIFGVMKHALDGVDLEVTRGSIVGLIGANGSGKSTLLRHIVGLYLPDSGTVTTLGRSAADLTPAELSRIGYVHQEGELLEWMTVEQLLRYVAAYYPTWNYELEKKYCTKFCIIPDVRVGTLSPGQRQMVAVLLAVAFEPELLILDEPAAAMDPLARREFLNLLLELIQSPNRTIVISSHILTDIEKVVDQVVILNYGRVLRNVSLDDLREEFTQVHLTSLSGPLPERLPFENVVESQRNGSSAVLTLRGQTPEKIVAMAEQIGAAAELQSLPLEELYRIVVEKAK